MQRFTLWVKMMGRGINDQVLLKYGPVQSALTVCVLRLL